MPSITFSCIVSNTSKDIRTGTTIQEFFYRDADAPPAGSIVTSATQSVSSLRVYSGKGMYLSLGSYGYTGQFSQNDAVHSTSVGVTLTGDILSQPYVTIPITISTAQSSTGNQVNFREGCVMTLTLNYMGGATASPSTGSLSTVTVEVGGSITLYISSSSSSNWHSATWTLGSYTWYQEIPASGTLSSFIIPESWANAITGSSATGRVSQATYNSSGTYIGSNFYVFMVTLSSSSGPTIGSFSACRVDGVVPSSWGVFVQGKSKIQLDISGATGSAGSSISSYKFSGGGYSWSSSTDTSYTTGFQNTAGSNTFTGTVTDTRGYSTSKMLTINVEPYDAPTVTSMNTYRAKASDDTPSETGENIIVRFTTSFSSVSGKNSLNRLIAFRRVGSSTWSPNTGASSDGSWRVQAGLSTTDTAPYEIRITLIDTLSVTTQYYDVAGAQYTMFFAKGGKNVSIGMAGSRVNAMEINPAWSIYHGNTNITDKLASTLAIKDGGTGATTQAGALTNLGAAAATHTHWTSDIVSGVLSVSRGGTGVGAQTASRALVTDANGNVTTSTTASYQLGYLSGVTSDIQSQLNSKTSIKVQYGSVFVDGNNASVIYFSGFSYTPYVTACYSTTGANWSGDNGAIKVYNKSPYSANVIVGGSFSTSRQIDWIAVGI